MNTAAFLALAVLAASAEPFGVERDQRPAVRARDVDVEEKLRKAADKRERKAAKLRGVRP